jgi:UDP-N-acetylmuramate dehydrogenase
MTGEPSGPVHSSAVFDRLAGALGGRRNHPLGELTTYRVGGPAAVFVTVESHERLDAVASVLATELATVDVPILVIGRGSNLLVSDRGYSGVVVQLGEFATECEVHAHGDEAFVDAGGASPLPVVARRTVAAGMSGFEWAVGVPGTIGGGVRMNAGGHGSDMAASLVSVDVVDLRSGRRERRSADRLGLRFRGSDLTDHEIVVAARLALRRGDPVESRRVLDEIVKLRREHQPGGQNAG